jgi:DNA-binding transcriptional ArsR family regulator
MVNEGAAILNRRITHMTPSHFSNAVYNSLDKLRHTLQSVVMTNSPALHPTLWRTCRVLANRTRLAIFDLLRKEQPLSVSAVAERLKLALPFASQSLRALEARGLRTSRRRNRSVLYRLNLDPGAALVAPVRQAFQRQSRPIEHVFRMVTAFTHPRRIEVYRALAAASRNRELLGAFTRIPERALRRHLAKLESRGFVQQRQGVYDVVEPTDELTRVLARLALE